MPARDVWSYCKFTTNNTLWLKGFPRNLFGKPSSASLIEDPDTISADAPEGVFALIARLLLARLFPLAPGQREREITPHVTALTWIAQALDGVFCRQALGQLADASKDQQAPGDSAYIAARDLLSLDQLHDAQQHLDRQLTEAARPEDLYRRHRVLAAAATAFSMPDTPQRRRIRLPRQPKRRLRLPHRPTPRPLLLSLAKSRQSGIHRPHHRLPRHHLAMPRSPLMVRLLNFLRLGDILMTDTDYSSWALIALLHQQGSQALMPLHQSRRLNPGLHRLPKPPLPRKHWTKQEWAALPDFNEIRVIAPTWKRPCFRAETLHLVTTLLDSKNYPDVKLIALHARGWDVELGFRNLKETMCFGLLRTKTADRIAKEIAINKLAYNILR